MNDNDMPPQSPPPQLRPEDILTQVGVILTKQGGTAVLFPQTPKGLPDMPVALELMATGLNALAQIMRQTPPQDVKRIIVVPGVPPGVYLLREADK